MLFFAALSSIVICSCDLIYSSVNKSGGGRPYLLVSFWSLYVVVDSFDIVSGWFLVALFEDGDWRNEWRQ